MRPYLPVLTITGVLLAASAALGEGFPRHFMGLFMTVFALFKLIDLKGFAAGFQKYDLLAARSNLYAWAYPFLELGLGLACLSGLSPVATNILVLSVMLIGAAGVVSALRKGLDVSCACLGTVLKVPLSSVALIENLAMAAMAGAGLWTGLRH